MIDVELGHLVDAERARDDVPARPGPRLVRREHALVDELLRLGVIARELRDPAAAHEIEPAVARPDAPRSAARRRAAPRPSSRRRRCRRARGRSPSGARWRAGCGPPGGPGGPAPRPATPIDRSASATVALASDPASCPPIPSATAKTPLSGRTRKWSSFCRAHAAGMGRGPGLGQAGRGCGLTPAGRAHGATRSRPPVSKVVNRYGSGMRCPTRASGGKSSPPIVHQTVDRRIGPRVILDPDRASRARAAIPARTAVRSVPSAQADQPLRPAPGRSGRAAARGGSRRPHHRLEASPRDRARRAGTPRRSPNQRSCGSSSGGGIASGVRRRGEDGRAGNSARPRRPTA